MELPPKLRWRVHTSARVPEGGGRGPTTREGSAASFSHHQPLEARSHARDGLMTLDHDANVRPCTVIEQCQTSMARAYVGPGSPEGGEARSEEVLRLLRAPLRASLST